MFGQKMTGKDATQKVLDAGVQRLFGRQIARDAAHTFAHLAGEIWHDAWRVGLARGKREESEKKNENGKQKLYGD